MKSSVDELSSRKIPLNFEIVPNNRLEDGPFIICISP